MKLKLNEKVKDILGILSTLIIISFLGLNFYFGSIGSDNQKTENEQSDILLKIRTITKEQEKIDKDLLKELNSNEYTFLQPLVVVNPYNNSPLTALALFTSEEPLKISIHISGKTKLSDVDFEFDGYNNQHIIPIYGLYPGIINEVQLIAENEKGEKYTKTVEVETENMPVNFEKYIIQADLSLPDKYQEGFNYTYDNIKAAFDVNGDFRWILNQPDTISLLPALYTNNENIILAYGSYFMGDTVFVEINTLGKIMKTYYSPYGVHHDITKIDNGNLLITGSNGESIEDFIYEVDISTGKITNTLDFKTILQRTRSYIKEWDNTDWLHMNSIKYLDGKILVSGRHQSAVVQLSWPEGKIDFILSDPSEWNKSYDKYLVSPVGNEFEWQYDQHAASFLPDYDNNSDTVDILLFDNGDNRFSYNKELMRAINNFEVVEPELYTRLVHYRINMKTKEVKQIWAFGKELGKTYYASARGMATLMENGNIIGLFNRNSKDSVYLEVSKQKEIVWEACISTNGAASEYNEYRTSRLPIYNQSANNLCIGQPAKDFLDENHIKED